VINTDRPASVAALLISRGQSRLHKRSRVSLRKNPLARNEEPGELVQRVDCKENLCIPESL
jgi:hypothetical protein